MPSPEGSEELRSRCTPYWELRFVALRSRRWCNIAVAVEAVVLAGSQVGMACYTGRAW
jgi:hypothetical protein